MTLSSLTCIFDGGKNYLAILGKKHVAGIQAALQMIGTIIQKLLQ